MQRKIDMMEKKVQLQKMETAVDDFELTKLKLMQKVVKIDSEIALQKEAVEAKKQELKALVESIGE